MGKTALSIAARVEKMIADSPAEPAESASTPEPSAAAPPTSAGSEVESASAGSPTEEAPAVDPTAAKHELLSEKLAAIRDARRRAKAESRISERTKSAEQLQQEAEQARKAAADEKAKYEALRTGTFRDTLIALGRDPREAFNEMQQ